MELWPSGCNVASCRILPGMLEGLRTQDHQELAVVCGKILHSPVA